MEYRKRLRSFMRALQRVLYFSGGQPPRGENDLWEMQFKNTTGRGRNLFYFDDGLVYVSSVNKTIWRHGQDGGIPHIFPAGDPSRILMQYLVYFRRLEVSIAMILTGQFSMDVVTRMLCFVFVDFNVTIGTQIFSRDMKVRSKELLQLHHEGIGISDIRQVLIYVSVRYLLPLVKDPDEGYKATFDIQAGHTTPVAQAHYGVDIQHLPKSMKGREYINFKVVCHLSHQFYRLADRAECEHVPMTLAHHLTPLFYRA